MAEILRTGQDAQHPWPEGTYLQGGARAVVLRSDGGTYRTAFVEAFLDGTFLRGEGTTVAEAETGCWEKYQRIRSCPTYPDHGPYERGVFTNGAGYCSRCGGWFPRVLAPLPDPPERVPSLMERSLTGDTAAAMQVIEMVADAESGETDG